MSVRRTDLLLLLALPACATQPDEALLAIEAGLAQEAAFAAASAVTGTLLMGAVASEVCAAQPGLWDDVIVGDAAPLSAALALALGEPTVASLSRTSATMATLELDGVTLLGWEGARLRLSADGDGEAMDLTASLFVDGERQGESAVSVLPGCGDVPRLSGEADWTDASGRAHALSYPLSENEELILDGTVIWLPTSGDLAWSSTVREDAISLETLAADALTIDESGELPAAQWPAQVASQGWTSSALIPIAP